MRKRICFTTLVVVFALIFVCTKNPVGGNNQPSTPTLASPSNFATGLALTDTLYWAKVSGATSYHVQVSTDSTFTAITVKDTLVTADSLPFASLLVNNTKYFWRVQAKNAGGASEYSSTWSFSTVKSVPVTEISNPTNSNNTVDYLVICNDSLYNSSLAFCQYRKLHKTSHIDSIAIVKWSTIQNAFDSTNYIALKSFLAYTLKSWHKSPQYVLLLGDNTVDKHGIPVIDSTISNNSDNYYADANGDGFIDFSMGRIPAQTNAEAIGVLNKIENYEQNIPTRIGFVVNDECQGQSVSPVSFESAFATIESSINSTGTSVDSFFLSSYSHENCTSWNDSLISLARSNLFTFLNKENGFVSLFGYSGTTQFTNQLILVPSDTGKITSNCIYFGTAYITNYLPKNSLGKSLLLKNGSGAVAVIGGFGNINLPAKLQQNFFSALLHKEYQTIGDLFAFSLIVSNDFSDDNAQILLGDPTMIIDN